MENFKKIIVTKIESINEKIIKELGFTKSLGIISGKLGFSIYFFKLWQLTKDKKYQKIGENIIDDIYINIIDNSFHKRFTDLLELGIGLDYVISESYVKGEANEVLEDIDKLIYQKTHWKNATNLTVNEYIQLLYYSYIRLKKQNPGSDTEFIFQEQVIEITNKIYRVFQEELFINLTTYSINFPLPFFLYILSKIHSLSFYNYRISKIFEELTPRLTSFHPSLHANRLFLLWGMVNVAYEAKIEIWNKPIQHLAKSIDSNHIIFSELKDKNILLYDGISSIFMMLDDLNKKTPEKVSYCVDKIRLKIYESNIWDENSEFQTGLISGMAGVIIVLELLNKNCDEENRY